VNLSMLEDALELCNLLQHHEGETHRIFESILSITLPILVPPMISDVIIRSKNLRRDGSKTA